jgi:non-heme chloroperoxidase
MILLAAVPPAPLGPLRHEALTTARVYFPPPETARELYFHDVDPAVFRWAAAQFCAASPSVLNEYSLGPGLPIDPARLTFPKLVLTGGQDRTVVPHDRSLADFYGADYAHFPDMGHDMMLERDWRAVVDAVRDWLLRRVVADAA